MLNFLSNAVAPLNRTLFLFGQDHVTSAEILGFATGLWCVWLTVKARLLNFPVGLANDAFFLVLFVAARLYADATLQIVYFVLGLVGWYAWTHDNGKSERAVRLASRWEVIALLLFVAIATIFLTWLLTKANDVAPFLDAFTTALSLAAQWMLNLKRVQNWWFWLIADAIYIPLYIYKHLWLTSIVYVAFFALCIIGWRAWRRELNLDPLLSSAPGRTT